MIELGKHAVPVLASYAVTLALIAGLVALSWARAVRMRRRLDRAEARARERRDAA